MDEMTREKGIYLLFSHDKGDWISRVMAWFTFARWTHVALVTDDSGYVIEASGYGKPHGVRMVPIGEWMHKHIDCVSGFIPHPFPEKVEELCRSQLGKAYDWAWLFGWMLRNKRIQHRDKWVCSELIAWACCEAGKPIFGGETHRVTPQMLYDISDALL